MSPKLSTTASDRIVAALERLRTSDLFANAPRQRRLLEYLVQCSMSNAGKNISQYAIGIDVFEREEAFDPTVDASVRVEVGRLRSKLREYYLAFPNEGTVIQLPKGGYTTEFVFNDDPSSELVNPQRQQSVVTPTLVVLPFVNFGSDAEQDYFADGITEDLITDLSKVAAINVIARQSAFVYKGATIDSRQICDELGATLLLEGSVRRSGDRVRINAQLIDGGSGQHIWAERFDRNNKDIFVLQDEINKNIVGALEIQLSNLDETNLTSRSTRSVDAHDYVLRGLAAARPYSDHASNEASDLYQRAIAIDPNYAEAYAHLSINSIFRWIAGWSDRRDETLDRGLSLAQTARDIDAGLALSHGALCWAALWQGDFDSAISAGRLALDLDSHDVTSLERLSLALAWDRQTEGALELLQQAREFNPVEPYYFQRACCAYMQGDYKSAIELLEKSALRQPNFIPSLLFLTASRWKLGLEAQAKLAASEVRRINPTYSVAGEKRLTFRYNEDLESLIEALRASGLG